MFDYNTSQRIQEAVRKTEIEHDYLIEFHIDKFGVLSIANRFVQQNTLSHVTITYWPRKNELAKALVDSFWSGINGDSFSITVGEFFLSGQTYKLSRITKLYPADPEMERWEDEIEVLYERDAKE